MAFVSQNVTALLPPLLCKFAFAALQPENLPQLAHRIFGILDGVAHGPRILEDLVVVAALERLVAEEMDGRVFNATWEVLLVLDVLQAVSLVPSGREDVEGDLAADGVSANVLVDNRLSKWVPKRCLRESQIRKLLLQDFHKVRANVVFQIKLLILLPLCICSITPNRGDIDHPIPELDECASLDRDIQICDVVQHELHELLVVVFPKPLDEAVAGERDAHAVGGQAIL